MLVTKWDVPSLSANGVKPDVLVAASGEEVVFGNSRGVLILKTNAKDTDKPFFAAVNDAFKAPKSALFDLATSKRTKKNLFQVGDKVIASFLVSETNKDIVKVFASIDVKTGKVTPLHAGFAPDEFRDIVSISADGTLAVAMVGDKALVTDGTVSGSKEADFTDVYNIFPIGYAKDFILVVGEKKKEQNGEYLQRFRGTNLNRGPVQDSLRVDPYEIIPYDHKLVVNGQAKDMAVREWQVVSVKGPELQAALNVDPVCKSAARQLAESKNEAITNIHLDDCAAYVSTGPDFFPSGTISTVKGKPSIVYSEVDSKTRMEIKYLPLTGEKSKVPQSLGTVVANQPFTSVYFGMAENNVYAGTTSSSSCFTVVDYAHGVSPENTSVYCYSSKDDDPTLAMVKHFKGVSEVKGKLGQEIDTCGTSSLVVSSQHTYFTDPFHNNVYATRGDTVKEVATGKGVYFHSSQSSVVKGNDVSDIFFVSDGSLTRIRESPLDTAGIEAPGLGSSDEIALIAGGVVGGLAAVAFLVAGVMYNSKRKNAKPKGTKTQPKRSHKHHDKEKSALQPGDKFRAVSL